MKKSLLATTAGLALAVPMTAPALASDHEDEAKTKGMCSVSSHWELKAETDDDGVKVEFEVDSRTAGQSWDYVISGPAGELAAGTATTDDEGEFEVEVITSGSITDAFTAVATTTDETCDSTVGIGQDSDDDEYDDEDSADDDSDEGKCTATSTIVLTVDKSGQTRKATLAVKSAKKGQKWQYKIKGGNKVVRKGSAKTKGKKAVFQVHARTKGKGALTADAQRSDHSEECTTDDQYDD
jgi:hypothetical protein